MRTLIIIAVFTAVAYAGAQQLEKSFSNSDTAKNIASRNIGY